MSRTMTVGLRTWLGCAGILAMGAGLAIGQSAGTQGQKPGSGNAPRRTSIYNTTADANVLVAKAIERAKHDNKRILLMFGGDWCGWCHKLHDLFQDEP